MSTKEGGEGRDTGHAFVADSGDSGKFDRERNTPRGAKRRGGREKGRRGGRDRRKNARKMVDDEEENG